MNNELYLKREEELKEVFGAIWIKEYDLKCEMAYFLDKCAKNGKRFKIGEFIKQNTPTESVNKLFDISNNNQDIEVYYKRYFLFKMQAKEKCFFDCDHLPAVFGEHRLVDYFFDEHFGVDIESPKDTCFSAQVLWGKVLANSKNVDLQGHYNDFAWQYNNLDIIKETLGEELFDTFGMFMHYYHTIGNIYPCPEKFNNLKYCGGKYFDRLDLFINSNEGKTFKEWFSDERVEQFCLGTFIEKTMCGEKELNEMIQGEQYVDLVNYINSIIMLIKHRSDDIMSKIYQEKKI